jgi:hypothetical protein
MLGRSNQLNNNPNNHGNHMQITSFTEFDPLEAKTSSNSEAALQSIKREIKNILSSYVGWYDPFCELIQNALDSVETRQLDNIKKGNSRPYEPQISILIDFKENKLSVSDNGIGLSKDQFQQFLAPNFSFKSGNTRGHKGVGATYVAYGFNYLQIATKTEDFSTVGKIIGARQWLDDLTPSGNPKVMPDSSRVTDEWFNNTDSGVSITVSFDDTTHPRKLDWIQADSASNWKKILCIKTGLGAVKKCKNIKVRIQVINAKGESSIDESLGIEYHWIHNEYPKSYRYREIIELENKLYAKDGAGFRHPDKINNLDFIFETWDAQELIELLGKNLDTDELNIIKKHTPLISLEFGYTAKLWQKFNESLGVRAGNKVMQSGIQLAANNMPQGETIQIPLNRNIGRQNQLHFLMHFDEYSPDLGRKGFHREITDFSKEISRKITETLLSKVRARLKANTGVAPDLLREQRVSNWKNEMLQHEGMFPLDLSNPNFFIPTKRISITSVPTREQDVIALFNQLIAGGVIRGIKIMSTNERLTYDGLFKISFDLPIENYVYDADNNPLGIDSDAAKELKGLITEPKVLEYKYCLDGLIEDFDNGDKNSKDVDLAIVWSTGLLYKERFGISTLLIPENISQRPYHGASHVLTDIESGQRVLDLIVLEELIDYLNTPVDCIKKQHNKYE